MARLFFGDLKPSSQAVAVIMAGGSGERFWPLSRRAFPKQFLSVHDGGPSLISDTARRLVPLSGERGVMVVCSVTQKELVEQHIPAVSVLAEPMPRNTAPCLGFAAVKVLETLGDMPMICVPADHFIDHEDVLEATYRQALQLCAAGDYLVTVGIRPQRPETGYGYIEMGDSLAKSGNASSVRRFVEKPDRKLAEEYLASGKFLWNSGMFAWRPSVFLDAVKVHLPELHRALMEIRGCLGKADESERIGEIFGKITPISVDFGVMEHAKNAVVIPADDFGWSDIGSWRSWLDCRQDAADAAQSPEDVVYVDSERCHVVRGTKAADGREKKFIACVGVRDLIIVETEDALLICDAERTQDVKKVVDSLKSSGRQKLL